MEAIKCQECDYTFYYPLEFDGIATKRQFIFWQGKGLCSECIAKMFKQVATLKAEVVELGDAVDHERKMKSDNYQFGRKVVDQLKDEQAKIEFKDKVIEAYAKHRKTSHHERYCACPGIGLDCYHENKRAEEALEAILAEAEVKEVEL